MLLHLVSDTSVSMEIASFATLALGNVYAGTAHGDIASTILQTMMERDDSQLRESYARFMCLGLGLLFLGMLVPHAFNWNIFSSIVMSTCTNMLPWSNNRQTRYG